ncbi:MAG: lysophospholipase [Treponema sp.]|jgi:alpha-beta hydrolase superfamily lysophospholipase|nr:lysophospholipase [Treponema sp.]
MVETTGWVESDDGTKLFLRRWKPADPGSGPKAIVHVVHGMTEHSLRYQRLAERLCGQGIEVWAADMRGHGKTADPSVNPKGSGGLLGHTADRDGFFRVVRDIGILTRHIRETVNNGAHSAGSQQGKGAPPACSAESRRDEDSSPGIPLFILGHSWGSFLVQGYIENRGNSVPLSGCILSGTRGPGGAAVTLGAPFLALLAFLKGCRRPSKIAFALSTGAYNKPFKPNRTPVDWLSRDEQEVDAFTADPLCSQPCSSGFYRDMIGGLAAIHREKAIARIDPALPVYVFCGSADPVGEMGGSPTKLVNAYRSHGIKDLEFVVYPDARHELLNETNREEVTEDLQNWLLRHLKHS